MSDRNSFWSTLKAFANTNNVKGDTFYPLTSHNISGLLGFDGSNGTIKTQQALIDEGYGSNVTAYSIIKKIAQTGADIPIYIYTINKQGEKEKVEKGDLYNALQRPSYWQGESLSKYDWMETAITYLLTTGNLYQRGVKATGFGDTWQQLQFLPSGLTNPIVPNSYFSQPTGYEVQDISQTFTVPFDEVLHTRFISPTSYGLNNFIGLSPLQASIYSLTGSTDIHKAIAVMVKNQGVRGVLTNESDRSMTPEEKKKAEAVADTKLRGLGNFNKLMVSNSKMNFLQVGMSASDLKIIESGVLTDRMLCNAYSFPSVLLNDPANTSYNNYREAMKALYNIAVIPVVNKIIDDLNNIWVQQFSKKENKKYWLEICKDEIEALQSDQKEMAEKNKTLSDSIVSILSAPITQESKVNALIYTHGMSEQTAKDIAGSAMPQPTPIQR